LECAVNKVNERDCCDEAKYNFRLLVDDAHGLVHLVKQVLEQVREFKMILMLLLNFAKSMANIGAFVAADKDIIDYLNTIYVLKCLQKHYL
jgi:7-keto-8-aminopelargonate synthetase-like enzyme